MTPGRPRWALVLSDGKPGHENQSLGVLPSALTALPFRIEYRSAGARRRAWLAARFAPLTGLAGRFPWSGLIQNSAPLADALSDGPPALIISTGSGPAPMNLLLARHLNAPAVTCMTPSVGLGHFDLALVPRHDHPPKRAAIVETVGAPNRIDLKQLKSAAIDLKARHGIAGNRFVAVLLGGDSPRHTLGPELAEAILDGCLALAARHGMGVVLTTSRRTSEASERRLVARASECAFFCPGRTNREPVVAGMLGLAALVVTTEDSVSMVSEAASAPPPVLTVPVARAGARPARRHEAVLSALAEGGYVRRVPSRNIAGDAADDMARDIANDIVAVGAKLLAGPLPSMLDDSARGREAVKKLVG